MIKWALPPEPGGVDPGIPFEVDATLRKLARRVGSALELEIVGVDVLQTEGGACINDANPFPGFRNVPDGAKMIADHLTSLTRGGEGVNATGPGGWWPGGSWSVW